MKPPTAPQTPRPPIEPIPMQRWLYCGGRRPATARPAYAPGNVPANPQTAHNRVGIKDVQRLSPDNIANARWRALRRCDLVNEASSGTADSVKYRCTIYLIAKQHGTIVATTRSGLDQMFWEFPRVAHGAQPWAKRRNTFGVRESPNQEQNDSGRVHMIGPFISS